MKQRITNPRKQEPHSPSRLVGLGLDLSLVGTGIVALDEQRVLLAALLATEPMPKAVRDREPGVRVKRDGSKVFRGSSREERIEFIRRRVASAIRKFEPGVVCIEGYSFASKGSSMTDLAELRGVILNVVHRAGLETDHIIAPPTLKKLATGNGGADKSEMIAAAQAMWPKCPDDDNIADAYHLAVEAQRRYAQYAEF